MARTRTFIGVETGDAVRNKVVAFQQKLAETATDVKWVTPGNLHVTLLFLGEVDDRDLMGVCRAVRDAAAAEPPFSLRITGLGAFPTPRRPKVVWAGLTDGADSLGRLYTALETRCLDLGCYRSENRPYTPHLTLGRVQNDSDAEAVSALVTKYAKWDGGRGKVEDVVVFGSELRRDGPEYTILARSPLRGKPTRPPSIPTPAPE